ncbi:MAG: PilC/PilY family type IV pilus protein [Pseudomonadota bacterium]
MRPALHGLLIAALLSMSGASWWAAGQSAPVATIALSSQPLSGVGGPKPALALVLSIGTSTAGAQHRQPVYAPANEYLGYFDTESCYAYVDDADPVVRRFERRAAADARRCRGAGFSGNFMNWATASTLDLLRIGLTGGDRIVDTPDLTVLQRAMLPASFFNNTADFPGKSINADDAHDALPAALLGSWTGRVFVANCLDRVHFGTSAIGNCTDPGDGAALGATLAGERAFRVRVKVCETAGSGDLQDPRSTYCTPYPHGDFKPTGALQRHGDRLRVAVFGYLLDDRDERYGGVLRAPMKPADMQADDALEWDPSTGVLRPNPDGAAEGHSGAIEYINRLGREPVEGTYRQRRPLSELYYEALRYLQGLPPTAAAAEGVTDPMKAGFPAQGAWTDPHANGVSTQRHACVRNDILAIGDANANNDKSIPGNTTRLDAYEFARAADPANNEPDFIDWTSRVARLESMAPRAGTDSRHAPVPSLFDMATAAAGANGGGYYMAGLAYWAHAQDVRGTSWSAQPGRQRPGMRIRTHALDLNEANASADFEMRRRSPLFLAAKYGAFDDATGDGNPFIDAKGRPDDSGWENAAAPGEPRSYRMATDARALLDGLDELISDIAKPDRAIAAVAATSDRIDPDKPIDGYQTQYDPRRWSGDLLAVPLTMSAGSQSQVAVAKAARWSAAAQLDAPGFDIAHRNIVIGRVDALQATATPFLWNRIEDTPGYSLKALLNRPPARSAVEDGLGEARLSFLRGDRTQESRLFRQRDSRLGDFIQSGVVHVGAPSAGIGSETYRSFLASHQARTHAVFAGANDGMLHAFDAANGNELFAYIPSWMGPQLSELSAPGYNTGAHRSFVDGTPGVADAELVRADGSTAWATVLVSGTGAGGQGVFALDVSDPATFDASKVLWEFTDRDDADIGNVLRAPQILKLRTNAAANAKTAATYRSYAVVASGVNSAVSDGRAATGGPALFLLDLSKPPGTAWKLNSNYFKISIPMDAALAATISPGVLDFSATTGAAGEVRYIYFGDLHGRLWKLDFLKASQAQWDMAHLSAFKSGTTPMPLFIAADDTQGAQPISMAPLLAAGPQRSVIVAFGTGKYLEPADNAAASVQSVYALYDSAGSVPDASGGASAISGRPRLAAGAPDGPRRIAVPDFAWGRPLRDGDTTQRAGWYIDLPGRGERQTGAMQTFGSGLVFSSLIPPDAAQACDGGGGNTWFVQLATGAAEFVASTVGMPSTPIVLQAGAAVVGNYTGPGSGSSESTGRVLVTGTGGVQTTGIVLPRSRRWGVLSWRRIHNYQDLKNAAN